MGSWQTRPLVGERWSKRSQAAGEPPSGLFDVSYAAPQAHRIVNVALHQEYSLGIVFIFSHGRKDLYHV
jgi:hypothetical protein